MNNKTINYFAVALVATLFAISCRTNPEMGAPLSKSQIKYSVTQDLSIDPGGNTVILSNTTPGTESLWNYGTGISTRQQDTIHYPFAGDYTIKFSAITGGGIVVCDSVVVRVTAANTAYISDPMFTLLAGGPNKSKAWLIDLDANKVSKAFTSPIYYAGVNSNGQPCKVGETDNGCWTYYPAYTGNEWITTSFNSNPPYGTMTFNLINGPYVTVDQEGLSTGNGTFNGTYSLDPTALTLTFNSIIQLNIGRTDQIYSKAIILSMTDTTMQLALRNSKLAEFEIYNYISQNYSNNWVAPPPKAPVPDDGFNPKFAPGQLFTILTGGTTAAPAGRFWSLDANGNPIDWIDHGNGWTTSAASSETWGWDATCTDSTQNAWVRFDNFGGTQNYSRYENGVLYKGTFTIDESTNVVTLSTGSTLITDNQSWMNSMFAANSFTVVKGWPTAYTTKGIWFGMNYDPTKDEWFAVHYIITN